MEAVVSPFNGPVPLARETRGFLCGTFSCGTGFQPILSGIDEIVEAGRGLGCGGSRFGEATIQPLTAHEWGRYTAIERFHEAIINSLPSPIPADQALRTVRILDGVYRSQKAGKEVRV